MDQILNCNTIGVLVHATPNMSDGMPDMSGIHRTETQTFCPWPYRTRPKVIPDTSDRCRTETINSLLAILHLSLLFI